MYFFYFQFSKHNAVNNVEMYAATLRLKTSVQLQLVQLFNVVNTIPSIVMHSDTDFRPKNQLFTERGKFILIYLRVK